jgi:hypothetical protein
MKNTANMHPRTVLLASFILSSFFCNSQSAAKKISKGGVGFSVTPFGKNRVIAGMEDEEYGRGIYTFSKTPFYSGNIYGFITIKKNTRLVIGAGYSYHEIYATENYIGTNYYYSNSIKAFTVPLYIEKTLFDYVFITFGGIVNMEYNYEYDRHVRIDEQSGFGLITSLGGTYHFKSGISVFAGPSLFFYSIFGSPLLINDKISGIGAELGMSIDL